jgi:Reverse transcriptase (RNA-dependent DNA polymerase)
MTTKWIFKEKNNLDGIIRYKARGVSRGFMQIPGVDYTELFAPVASDTGMRVVIGIFLYQYNKNTVLDSVGASTKEIYWLPRTSTLNTAVRFVPAQQENKG